MARKIVTYAFIVVTALICALNYQLFVFPNSFAPAGLNGICTMIQYIFGFRVGYLSLIINVPLALLVYFKVSKPLALRSMVYVVSFSLALLVLDYVDLSRFAYETENGTSRILGPLVAGVIQGTSSSWLIRASAYSGGTDFVAALIHKNHPDKSIFGLIFTINALVAVSSYFVYDYKMEPVILCILYSFTSSTVSERAVKSGRSAVRFEIVTDHAEEISDAIITRLHRSATVVPARGMYSGRDTRIVICVIGKTQVATLSDIVREYPDTFAVMSGASQVIGNFKKLNNHNEFEKEFLDQGDGKAV